MSAWGQLETLRDLTGMSPPGGRADVIGVKADIASLAGRPGLRRRRNRLASGYIWPYSAISALRLPRALPTPGSRSWGAYTGPRSRNTGMRTGTATITPRIGTPRSEMSPLRALLTPRRRRRHGWGNLNQSRISSQDTACASPSASLSRVSPSSTTPASAAGKSSLARPIARSTTRAATRQPRR